MIDTIHAESIFSDYHSSERNIITQLNESKKEYKSVLNRLSVKLKK